MNKALKTTGIVLVILTTLTFIGLFVKKQIGLVSEYCTKIKGFKVVSLTSRNFTFSFDFYFMNKSKLAVEILSIDLDIFVNNVLLGKVLSVKKVTIVKNGVSTIPLTASLDLTSISLSEITPIVALYFADKTKVLVQMKGNMRIKKGIFEIPAKIDVVNNIKDLTTKPEVPINCNI
ncbi:MAG: hypothetical protein WCT77_00305 [Bacteroidota bacterium]|jgi:LEA14-like dessication related protein